MRHEHGFMRFTEVPGGTRVRWHSEFAVASPVLSGALTVLMKPFLQAGFQRLLSTAARILSAQEFPGGATTRDRR